MVAFSKACLEGRALEDALAGDKGLFARMNDGHQGKWVQVKTAEAMAARSLLSTRWIEKCGRLDAAAGRSATTLPKPHSRSTEPTR